VSEYEERFGGIGRLYGREGWARLRAAQVCVVGVGGVGSWAVEALARSGIGKLTLVDLDDVCVSNVNRQLPALSGEIGKPKVEVLAARCKAINSECEVKTIPQFFLESTAEEILGTKYDYVFDAIDSVMNKCVLIASCREKNIPIISAGGAGGRRDPTMIKVLDLAQVSHDPLMQKVRKKLRGEFGFPPGTNQHFGVDCVFTTERPVFPQRDGTVCPTRDAESDLKLTCEGGYGTATFVTGAFGFAGAGVIVRRIAEAKT
jgi:tRNA threonylcarbamoyladenosine dehydratase